MFTVKLFAQLSEGEFWKHVSCPHYCVEKYSDGTAHITCYKDMSEAGGTEFIVSPDSWHACFVENSTGKTVDKHRAGVQPNGDRAGGSHRARLED